MQLGMVGLGRMGSNMVKRLLAGGHECVATDLDAAAVERVNQAGARGVGSLQQLVEALDAPRAVWVMVPAGGATESVVSQLAELLSAGDVVIDGGNGYYRDDIRRASSLAEHGIDYIDAGTSGGVWGLERGYCLMLGGPGAAVERLAPIFRTLAPGVEAAERTHGRQAEPASSEQGWLHCGPVGSGHFVKMVHNGIEYGVMQAYAEGFDILRAQGRETRPAEERFELAVDEIAELWRRGSVIGSWLLDLTAQQLLADPALERYEGHVPDSGEGRWTIQTAIEQATPAEVLSSALYARFRSRQQHTFAEKVLSAMRAAFGGHAERPDQS